MHEMNKKLKGKLKKKKWNYEMKKTFNLNEINLYLVKMLKIFQAWI